MLLLKLSETFAAYNGDFDDADTPRIEKLSDYNEKRV